MDVRGCSGSQKVGARKIARCHFQVPVLKVRSQFRSQLKYLQGANFFVPKLWMIACTTTSFMYKWSGFVCTNVNVCIVLHKYNREWDKMILHKYNCEWEKMIPVLHKFNRKWDNILLHKHKREWDNILQHKHNQKWDNIILHRHNQE